MRIKETTKTEDRTKRYHIMLHVFHCLSKRSHYCLPKRSSFNILSSSSIKQYSYRSISVIGNNNIIPLNSSNPAPSLHTDLLSLRNFSTEVWFPLRTSNLFEATKHTIEAGTHLEADHPGFHDSVYRKRRDELASIARGYNPDTDLIPVIDYTDNEIYCWSEVWNRMEPLWGKYACKQFLDGLEEMKRHCNYNKDEIPKLEVVSKYLESKTNFVIKPVPGQLSSRTFLNGLAFRIFFCTQYVRHHSKPLYTPEPDVCHELLGHAPMLADRDFCDFSQEIGLASIGATDEEIVKLARCYWFSVEFGICEEEGSKCDEAGTRISLVKAYGAGLLSSFGELEHVLANDGYDKPVHEPWCPRKASNQEHPLTTYQPLYFLAGSVSRDWCNFVSTSTLYLILRQNAHSQHIHDHNTITAHLNRFNM